MGNINDYLDWRGDIPIIKEFKFNEVDSMIMARFSYLIFNKIKMKPSQTIKELSSLMSDFDNSSFRYNGDKNLITKLGKSKRFKNLIVTDYVENNDVERIKQFSAITIHLPKNELYISFLGTDSSVYGWKEDFNMAYMENVPSQIAGKEYLEKIASKYPNEKIRIGGHSKGGNVAIYASISASKEIQNRIIKVYNYDGPGFNELMVKSLGTANNILPKIESYIPQDSIIGRVMEHREKICVIKSLEKGILQHDIYSWQVLGKNIVKAKNVTKDSEIINKMFIKWLNETSIEKRRLFCDSIFGLLFSTEEATFKGISENLTTSIPKIIKAYQNIPKNEKKEVINMVKLFFTSYYKAYKEEKPKSKSKIKESTGIKTKEKPNKIIKQKKIERRKNI